MELLDNLWLGMSVVLTPINLLYLFVGAMVGMVVGIMLGLAAAAGIAILLPVTFGMDPTGAVVMLAAIYYAAMYGGTITSILLNTPGESATVASTFDGYPLMQQGQGAQAMGMSAVCSFIGGILAALLLSFTDFDIYALGTMEYARWVGFRNYVELLRTAEFWTALGNTLYFVLVAGPLTVAVALAAAILITSKLTRFKSLFRLVFFACFLRIMHLGVCVLGGVGILRGSGRGRPADPCRG
jgi:hypothetical protein